MRKCKTMDFNNIISFLISPDIQTKLFSAKVAFLAVSLFFLVLIIFVLLRTHYLRWMFFNDTIEFFTFRQFGAKKRNRTWNKILRRLETGTEPEYKLAVIEADNMLDGSLKRMEYVGQSFEERLKNLTPAVLPNIAEVCEAHKIRNSIVHNPDYRLSSDEVQKTLEGYRQAFQALQMI